MSALTNTVISGILRLNRKEARFGFKLDAELYKMAALIIRLLSGIPTQIIATRRGYFSMNNNFTRQAYAALFNILDNQYNETKDNSLALLLGDMNPDLFVGSESADPAVYEDFYDCVEKSYSGSHTADAKTAYLASMQFLRMYRDEFGFELQEVIKAMDYGAFEEAFQKLCD